MILFLQLHRDYSDSIYWLGSLLIFRARCIWKAESCSVCNQIFQIIPKMSCNFYHFAVEAGMCYGKISCAKWPSLMEKLGREDILQSARFRKVNLGHWKRKTGSSHSCDDEALVSSGGVSSRHELFRPVGRLWSLKPSRVLRSSWFMTHLWAFHQVYWHTTHPSSKQSLKFYEKSEAGLNFLWKLFLKNCVLKNFIPTSY